MGSRKRDKQREAVELALREASVEAGMMVALDPRRGRLMEAHSRAHRRINGLLYEWEELRG